MAPMEMDDVILKLVEGIAASAPETKAVPFKELLEKLTEGYTFHKCSKCGNVDITKKEFVLHNPNGRKKPKMNHKAKNFYKPWDRDEDRFILVSKREGKTTKQIARQLKRSLPSVQSRWTKILAAEEEKRQKEAKKNG